MTPAATPVTGRPEQGDPAMDLLLIMRPPPPLAQIRALVAPHLRPDSPHSEASAAARALVARLLAHQHIPDAAALPHAADHAADPSPDSTLPVPADSIVRISDSLDLRLQAAARAALALGVDLADIDGAVPAHAVILVALATPAALAPPLAHPIVAYARTVVRRAASLASAPSAPHPAGPHSAAAIRCASLLAQIADRLVAQAAAIPAPRSLDAPTACRILHELALFHVAAGAPSDALERLASMRSLIAVAAIPIDSLPWLDSHRMHNIEILCRAAAAAPASTVSDPSDTLANIPALIDAALRRSPPIQLRRIAAAQCRSRSPPDLHAAVLRGLCNAISQALVPSASPTDELFPDLLPAFCAMPQPSSRTCASLLALPELAASRPAFADAVSAVGGESIWRRRVLAVYLRLYLNSPHIQWRSMMESHAFFQPLFHDRAILTLRSSDLRIESNSNSDTSLASTGPPRCPAPNATAAERDVFLRQLLYSGFRANEVNYIAELTPLVAQMPGPACTQLLRCARSLFDQQCFDYALQLATMAKLCAVTSSQSPDLVQSIDRLHQSAVLSQLVDDASGVDPSVDPARLSSLCDRILDVLMTTGLPETPMYCRILTMLIEKSKLDVVLRYAQHLSQHIAESSSTASAAPVSTDSTPHHIINMRTLYNLSRVMVLVVAMIETLDRNGFPLLAYTIRMPHALDILPDAVVHEIHSFARQLSRWLCQSDPACGDVDLVHASVVDMLTRLGRRKAFGLLASSVGAVYAAAVSAMASSPDPSLMKNGHDGSTASSTNGAATSTSTTTASAANTASAIVIDRKPIPEALGTVAACAAPILVTEWPTESERRVAKIAIVVLSANHFTATDIPQLASFLRKLCLAWASLSITTPSLTPSPSSASSLPQPVSSLTTTTSRLQASETATESTDAAISSASPYWLLADLEFCTPISNTTSSHKYYLDGILTLTSHLSRMDRLDPFALNMSPKLLRRFADCCIEMGDGIGAAFLAQWYTQKVDTVLAFKALGTVSWSKIASSSIGSTPRRRTDKFVRAGSISITNMQHLMNHNPFACFWDTNIIEFIVYHLRLHSRMDLAEPLMSRLIRVPEFAPGYSDRGSRLALIHAIQAYRLTLMVREAASATSPSPSSSSLSSRSHGEMEKMSNHTVPIAATNTGAIATHVTDTHRNGVDMSDGGTIAIHTSPSSV